MQGARGRERESKREGGREGGSERASERERERERERENTNVPRENFKKKLFYFLNLRFPLIFWHIKKNLVGCP